MFFNTTAVDGEDNISSTIKHIGGSVFEAQKVNYVKYLNNMQNARNENMWQLKDSAGMVPEALKTLKDKFAGKINVVRSGKLETPQKPDELTGEINIYDKTANLETNGYLSLISHGQRIDIDASPDGKGYNIGYLNGKQADGTHKKDMLPIKFMTEEDALRVANLVNFYKKYYKGLGTSDQAFNISAYGNDLEFAEDGVMDWMDLTALDSKDALAYSKDLAGNNLNAFAVWLNNT